MAYIFQHLNFNSSYEESELIALLKQKNLEALSSLYDKYAPALYTVVLQIARDKEIANEALQQVFLRIINNIDNYDVTKERLFIWMFKIARNTAIDIIKSKNLQNAVQTPLMPKISHEVANLEVDNYGLKKMTLKLNEEHKILVDLRYYKGFTHDEIARALNISVDMVQPKLRMALVELRTLLL